MHWIVYSCRSKRYLIVELIRDGHSFVFLRFMTGSGNFRHPINNQSDAKLKPSRDLVARVFPRFKLFACYYSGHLMTQYFHIKFCCVFVGCWDCKSFWFECALWWAFTSEIKMYSRYLLIFHRNSELCSCQEGILYWQTVFISKPCK